MSTDLLYSQPVTHAPGTDFQHDQIGSTHLNPSLKNKTSQDSTNGDNDDFLKTLQRVSQDQVPTNPPKRDTHELSAEADVPVRAAEADAPVGVAEADAPVGIAEADAPDGAVEADALVGAAATEETPDHTGDPAGSAGQVDQKTDSEKIAPDHKYTALINVLENLGYHDAMAGSGWQRLIDSNQLDGNLAAEIKLLLGRFQQSQILPAVDRKAIQPKLQQLMANISASISYNPDPAADLAKLNQWIRDFVS